MGGAEPPRANTPVVTEAVAATHRWAHAFQNVNNLGGHSFLNLWQPAIGANQIFSLSQHWYTGGSGNGLQTAEVGWQVYPQFYGNNRPCSSSIRRPTATTTRAATTSAATRSCRRTTRGRSAARFAAVQHRNGSAVPLEVSFYLYRGRWWLYVKGTQAANAIGYYPVSIYNNGALAGHASEHRLRRRDGRHDELPADGQRRLRQSRVGRRPPISGRFTTSRPPADRPGPI